MNNSLKIGLDIHGVIDTESPRDYRRFICVSQGSGCGRSFFVLDYYPGPSTIFSELLAMGGH